jgi:hypothetical protein
MRHDDELTIGRLTVTQVKTGERVRCVQKESKRGSEKERREREAREEE